jgi:hypothetical protein
MMMEMSIEGFKVPFKRVIERIDVFAAGKKNQVEARSIYMRVNFITHIKDFVRAVL